MSIFNALVGYSSVLGHSSTVRYLNALGFFGTPVVHAQTSSLDTILTTRVRTIF